ncbi:MAG: TraR/DksA C4-type zinc finger protein [Proteobacteria bacterium]|nr:TraR/DksA C4-type zinc finger protein [Pseudomonadota bacterium]
MDIEVFKFLLLERKAALIEVEETSKGATQIVELDQASVGRLSRMDAMQGQAMAIATNQRRVLELQQIEAALKRIDYDEFGYCFSCDEEIAEPRLKLDATTSLCIDCASKKESS